MKTFNSPSIDHKMRCNCTHNWHTDVMESLLSSNITITLVDTKKMCPVCNLWFWTLNKGGYSAKIIG